jgi:hypothetical protein
MLVASATEIHLRRANLRPVTSACTGIHRNHAATLMASMLHTLMVPKLVAAVGTILSAGRSRVKTGTMEITRCLHARTTPETVLTVMVETSRVTASLDLIIAATQQIRLCLVEKFWVKGYCSTFRCYLVKFVQPWIN